MGALSEVYVGLARRTHNSSWLEAAALFDRRCFTGPLALAGALHDQRGGGGGVWAQAADEATAAGGAVRGMHANANLAYALGAAARYEATGERRSRWSAEALWRELQQRYSFVSGGSSFQEEWRPASGVEETLHHAGAGNWAAHDHSEQCVTHHSMLLARRLSWLWPGGGGGGGGAAVEASPELSEVVALSEWTERTLYSSVLSSQRGTSPGVLLYMLPLGGGVSKAGGGHKWSSPESHFWCCMGSAVEAFGRLAESVYWRAGGGGGGAPRHLYLLQPTVHRSCGGQARAAGCGSKARRRATRRPAAASPFR